MPPMPVDIVLLEAKPVEQTTEFVGTIKSRRQTSVQPQVEGYITRIDVKSGDRVGTGAALMEIDSRSQQAACSLLGWRGSALCDQTGLVSFRRD